MFIINLLINDVVLNVRLGNKIRKDIKTEVGICQGDCLSALLFIFYLAHAIKELPTHIEKEDYARSLCSELDWHIQKDQHEVEIDPRCADDVSFLRSNESKMNQVKRMIPNMLQGLKNIT